MKDNPPGKLYLDPNNSTDEPLTYMTPSTPTEAVGVWQDGDGKSNKQFWSLIEKVQKLHIELEAHPLPRHLVWMGFRQAIWPSIAYVLPAMSLCKRDAMELNKALYRPLLPKLGCNRKFPLLLRYNPPHHMGLGLFDT